MQDEVVSPSNLTPQQKRWMGATRVLFWIAIVNCLCLGTLTVFYGMTCPTVANVESGHTFPFFDKIYGRYVYVTETEQNALPILVCFGVGCVFTAIAIDLDLKRQFRSSARDRSG